MNNSSEIEPISYGPAGITMEAGEREMEIIGSVIITGRYVEETAQVLAELLDNVCEYDEKTGKAYRIVDSKRIEADPEKMKKIIDKRKKASNKSNDDMEK